MSGHGTDMVDHDQSWEEGLHPKMHGGRLAGLFPTLMHAETTVANNTGITK